MDFLIPLKNEDLLKGGEDCYSVTLISFEDAVKKIDDLRFSIKKTGVEAIFEHFDVCFSFLYRTDDSSFSQLQDFFEDVIEEYLKRVCTFVEKSIELDPTAKKKALNVIKMIFYMFSMCLKCFEEKLTQSNANFISEPKKAKMIKSKNRIKPEESWSWYDKKLNAFTVIYSFLQLPISNLWQTLIVEEPFIKLIAGCCYKTFENNEINLVKSKPLRDSVSQVLCVLVINYNHTYTFVPRVVELMKQHEHSSSPIANTVLLMYSGFGCQTILDRILKELLDASIDDPQSLGKPTSIFISELGENHPETLITSVDILLEFLSIDAYSIRNAVMVTFCEMVIHCFGEEKLTDKLIETRNKILKIMKIQIHDENAYVRSKVVHLWAKLASSSCIPVSSYVKLLKDIKHRLLDKSTNVSKNAINFFTMALEHNPYGGKLQLNELNKEKESEMLKLKEYMTKQPLPPEEHWAKLEVEIAHSITEYFDEHGLLKEIPKTEDGKDIEISDVILTIGNLINEKFYKQAMSLLEQSEYVFPDSKEIRCNVDKLDKVSYYISTLKKIYLRAAELAPQTLFPEYYENINKIESVRTVVTYLEACIDFIECINKAADTIYKLMFSTNPSEVLEAIAFFSKAYKFHIGNTEKSVSDMLLLVNSNNLELKDAVAKAYECLYLETNKTNARARSAQIAHRLLKLVKGLDNDQKLALEKLLQTWVESNKLDNEFISVLFEKVVQPIPGKSLNSDCNASLFLIEMIARVKIPIVVGNISHLRNLLKLESDNLTIQLVCSLLSKLGSTKHNGKPLRYKNDNEIFELTINILLKKYESLETPEFVNMTKSIVDMIFQLCYKPEELGNDILYKMYQALISKGINFVPPSEEDGSRDVPEILLERMFFVFGHIVFRKWQYCDKDVFNCLKRCHDGVVDEKQLNQSIDEFEMEADNIVAADDALYEEITSICNKFLDEKETVVHHIMNLIIAVCQCNDDKVSQALKASAALSLAKLMFTSDSLCEQHFQLYVTLMDRCKYMAVRSNLVLGFGDLLCRFPNTVEPWTPYIYSRLKDHSEVVRLNTVSVLCHLISREMIKVRGQFAELILHLEDPHPIIAEKVNSLLLDLSRKGNTIYNVIPDIISKLSNPERSDPIASSTFKLVIGRIFEMVTKERQSDLLVEKLCSRLRESANERQWEDLAYCLSQIKYSEKSLHKLSEALPTFSERLFHPPVHDTILTIINTCTKSTKSTLKEIAQEANDNLEELMTAKNKDETITTSNESKGSPINNNIDLEENGLCNTTEKETPCKPFPKNPGVRRTTTKVPKTPKTTSKVNQHHTRSTRKRKV